MVCLDILFSFSSQRLGSPKPVFVQRQPINVCKDMSHVSHSPSGYKLSRKDGLHCPIPQLVKIELQRKILIGVTLTFSIFIILIARERCSDNHHCLLMAIQIDSCP